MDTLTVILIAVGLAMDALAVSTACGITITSRRAPNALKIALSFGFFQAVMPAAGWIAGRTLVDFVREVDHWIAFILLAYIGSKMLYDALKNKDCARPKCAEMEPGRLFMLSIATSIDALAVGVTFAFLDMSIIIPVILIGLITFVLSLAGFIAGEKLGRLFGRKIEIFGGVILIGIGVKILTEDLFFK